VLTKSSGELVCFFRAPPRLVHNIMSTLSISSAKNSESSPVVGDEPIPRLFQSPALVSEAIRRLSLAASDRSPKSVENKRPESGDPISRIMTNLLTFPHHRLRRESDSVRSDTASNHMAMVAPRRSTVVICNTTTIAGGDRRVAVDYVFISHDVLSLCATNAVIANNRGRYDHERIFKALGALLGTQATSLQSTNLLTKKMLQQM
jgi:WD repeat-containing protein 59